MEYDLASLQSPEPSAVETVDSQSSATSKTARKPVTGLRQKITRLFRKESSLKQALEDVLVTHETKQDKDFQTIAEQSTMVRNVLEFTELRVEDVMVPRADIMWLEYATPNVKLMEEVANNGHTRMPVCRGILDDVVGFLHMKDLVIAMARHTSVEISHLIREVLFVPPSMKASALLLKMQASRVHMAIVVDEYGGTSGLVTIEDLVEQIVGQIEDEHDENEEVKLRTIGQNVYEASARLPIETLMERLKFTLEEEHRELQDEVSTLGGFITYVLGRLPAVGEVIPYGAGAWEFEVKEADARRVKRVRIRHKPSALPLT